MQLTNAGNKRPLPIPFLAGPSSLAIPDLSLWDKGCLQTGSCDIEKGMTRTASTYPHRDVLL